MDARGQKETTRTEYRDRQPLQISSLTLPAFGIFYGRHVEALVGSTEDAKDPDAVSRACYAAAIIYAAFIGFCGLQVSLARFMVSPLCGGRRYLEPSNSGHGADITVDRSSEIS